MKKQLTVILLCLIAKFAYTQDLEFGKVSAEEMHDHIYEQDTAAVAVVMFKDHRTYFNYEHPDGWIIITEVFERIKILKKEGLDHATKQLNLYRDGGSKEKITRLEGLTHNLEGDNVKSVKLKKGSIFNTKNTSNWNKVSFAMPNVKVGSVIEWSYSIESPFWKIDDIVFQDKIPIALLSAKIQIPTYFNFKRFIKGDYQILPKEYFEEREMTVYYEEGVDKNSRIYSPSIADVRREKLTKVTKKSLVRVKERISEYNIRNVKALTHEPFVDNIDNYVPTVVYELASVKLPNSERRDFARTWEEVVKAIYENEDFGDQLNRTRFLNEDADRIKQNSSGEIQIVNNAFDLVKNKMSWDGIYGKYTRDGLQKAYKNSSGNVSEINLLLLALLRKCNIDANPILVSSRKHGIPLYPTLEGFNYVLVGVEINGKLTLLDATEKLSKPNLLPTRALNWEGTLVKEDGTFQKIGLYPIRPSQKKSIMNVEINKNGSLQGNIKTSYSDLEALNYRKEFMNVSKDEHIERIMNKHKFVEISELITTNISDLSKSVIESYDFEVNEGVDVIGDEIYFSPLLFLKLDENPFKSEERNYPIDFITPFSIKRIVSIRIPENYTVQSLPSAIKISLPDNQGSFLFNVNKVDGGVNVMTDFKINHAKIPSYKYEEIKEFFSQRLLKETEKVLLKKINQ